MIVGFFSLSVLVGLLIVYVQFSHINFLRHFVSYFFVWVDLFSLSGMALISKTALLLGLVI